MGIILILIFAVTRFSSRHYILLCCQAFMQETIPNIAYKAVKQTLILSTNEMYCMVIIISSYDLRLRPFTRRLLSLLYNTRYGGQGCYYCSHQKPSVHNNTVACHIIVWSEVRLECNQ